MDSQVLANIRELIDYVGTQHGASSSRSSSSSRSASQLQQLLTVTRETRQNLLPTMTSPTASSVDLNAALLKKNQTIELLIQQKHQLARTMHSWAIKRDAEVRQFEETMSAKMDTASACCQTELNATESTMSQTDANRDCGVAEISSQAPAGLRAEIIPEARRRLQSFALCDAQLHGHCAQFHSTNAANAKILLDWIGSTCHPCEMLEIVSMVLGEWVLHTQRLAWALDEQSRSAASDMEGLKRKVMRLELQLEAHNRKESLHSSPRASIHPGLGDCEWLDQLASAQGSAKLWQPDAAETQHCSLLPAVQAAARGMQDIPPAVGAAVADADAAHADQDDALPLTGVKPQRLPTESTVLSAQESAIAEMNRKLWQLDEAYSALVRERKEVMLLLSSPATPTATSDGDGDGDGSAANESRESFNVSFSGFSPGQQTVHIGAAPQSAKAVPTAQPEPEPPSDAEAELSAGESERVLVRDQPVLADGTSTCFLSTPRPVRTDSQGNFGLTPSWCGAHKDECKPATHDGCLKMLLHTPLESRVLPSLVDDSTGDLGKQFYSLAWMGREHSAESLVECSRLPAKAKRRMTLRVVALAVMAARRINRARIQVVGSRPSALGSTLPTGHLVKQTDRSKPSRPPKPNSIRLALSAPRSIANGASSNQMRKLQTDSPGAKADSDIENKENLSACASNRRAQEQAEDGSTAAALDRCKSLESQVLEYAMFHQKRSIGTRMRDSTVSPRQRQQDTVGRSNAS